MSENVALRALSMIEKKIVADTADSPDSDKHLKDPDSTSYRNVRQREYDDLFEELEFRSQRAAMMHYHEANRYSRKCYYMEVTAALLGTASVSGVGACLLQWNSGGEAGLISSRLGLCGLFGAVVSLLIELAGKGSTKLIPSLNKRLVAHKKAAVGWQRLTRLTRSYRIQLRNPDLDVRDYVAWYAELVAMRQEVSKIAMVPSSTYREFNDPGRVFAALRRKRNMFLRYQEMYDGKQDVDDDYDDD
nr:hypothetical protein BaRGS_034769 [Batillaria attramentaria]